MTMFILMLWAFLRHLEGWGASHMYGVHVHNCSGVTAGSIPEPRPLTNRRYHSVEVTLVK